MPQWIWNVVTILGAGIGAYIGVAVKLARVETQIAFMLKSIENLERRVHRLSNRTQVVVNRLTVLEWQAGIKHPAEPTEDELERE